MRQWVSPVHTTSPKADYGRWGDVFRERGWLDPTAAEQLRQRLADMQADRDWFRDLYTEAVDTYERRLAGTYQPRDENVL